MTDPNFFIETPRLYLTYFQPTNIAHCEFLVKLYNTPEFIASIGGKPTSITNVGKARTQLEGRFRAEHARNGHGTYLVSLRSTQAQNEGFETFADSLASLQPIGTVSLMRGDGPNSYSVPDLGFAILPNETRKGYATEAANGLLHYAKEHVGVDAVVGLFDPSNEASKGVFQKLGFEDRGTRRLEVFGGVIGAVWTLPGMAEDLTVYGF